ncbi:MAG: hypothetical protein RJA87_2527 [Pseudomonadota bacterium]
MRDLSGDNAVDLAVLRLERAVSLLEARLGDVTSAAQPNSSGLFDEDRSRLAAELDASRAREQALTEAGRQASAALGKAIVGIKSALTEEADLFSVLMAPSDAEA